jgi:Putative DNA-binding domain
MISLAERQSSFMDNLLNEDSAPPEHWTSRQAEGMAIYRNNYRTTLVDALLDTFQRTARWVGEDVFRTAAAHYLIMHPPSGWTLDDVGDGFDLTLAELFANDPEVSELAWVEWSMHRAFGAADAKPLTAKAFADATSSFGEPEWGALCFNFMPRIATRVIEHEIAAIWHALEDDAFAVPEYAIAEPLACHVYRERERPTFITAPAFETSALSEMIEGAQFGDIVDALAEQFSAESAATNAGEMLGRWLHNNLVTGLR